MIKAITNNTVYQIRRFYYINASSLETFFEKTFFDRTFDQENRLHRYQSRNIQQYAVSRNLSRILLGLKLAFGESFAFGVFFESIQCVVGALDELVFLLVQCLCVEIGDWVAKKSDFLEGGNFLIDLIF